MPVVDAFVKLGEHTRNLPFIIEDIEFLHHVACLCTASILRGVFSAIHCTKIHFRAQASII